MKYYTKNDENDIIQVNDGANTTQEEMKKS